MENRTSEPFGAVLKRYRVAALLTQEELAARAHLSADAIRALEHGKRRTPRPDTARLLADGLALTGTEREALLAAAVRPKMSAIADNGDTGEQDARLRLGMVQPNRLLGRERELATIRERLTGAADSVGTAGSEGTASQSVERARLLTLTGPAGVGKTRLVQAAAAQVAGRFADGVTFVDLSPVRDPLLVLPIIARAVGLTGVGSRPLRDRLHDYLRPRSMLLVLDNFEQVLPAATMLADLLGVCPHIALLVTSRVPLRLRWEWTLRVAPLPVPDLNSPLDVDALMGIPSVALFVERARARRSDFVLTAARAPLVARIASELDGLPLALELAAARLDVFSLSMIAGWLGDRLRLLRWEAADVPGRQQSLEAAIGWSYDLLTEPEQRLFRCLGPFAGRVGLDAIAAVVAAVTAEEARAVARDRATQEADQGRVLEQLASLAEKSLLLPARQRRHEAQEDGATVATEAIHGDDDPEAAFAMLETVREYAWERLAAAGELEVACRAHARYFLALTERADAHLRDREQRVWYRRLEDDQANLRAALRWLLDQKAGAKQDAGAGAQAAAEREAALRLAAATGWFWWTRGYLEEGRRWLEEGRRGAPNADPSVCVQALLMEGAMTAYQGAFDDAVPMLEQAMTLAQRRQQPAEVARTLAFSGLRALYAGDVAASVLPLQEALDRGRMLGDPHLLGLVLLFRGSAAFAQGQGEQAASLFAESLAQFETAGDGLWAANLHVNLAWFASQQGDLPTAVEHIRMGLETGLLFVDRRLLGVGGHMVLSLPWTAGKPADLAERARLLGAIDAMSDATGMTLLQSLLKPSVAPLRDQLTHAGLEATYRDGRMLSLQATAGLALRLLERVPLTMVRALATGDHRADEG